MRRIPPESSFWTLQKKQEEEIVVFLEKVEQSGKWPQQAHDDVLLDTEESHE